MRMPEFHLSDEERFALTNVLLSFREEKLPESMLRRSLLQNVFQPQGRMGEIFAHSSCTKCHSVLGEGGDVAPDLSKAGSRLTATWLRNFLAEPVSRRPLIEERMPDLVVLPSLNEGQGRAAVEAMAAGLPVVASEVGGLPEVLDAGRAGVLVPAGDPEALGRALESLASSPTERDRLMEAGRRRAGRYSETAMLDATESLYSELLGAGGGSS